VMASVSATWKQVGTGSWIVGGSVVGMVSGPSKSLLRH
jgi:hypothetical protein